MKSFKGTQGGYELNKKPEEITLANVIETVEGTYYLSRCLNPEQRCNREGKTSCKVQRVFSEISKMVQTQLENVTIAQLI